MVLEAECVNVYYGESNVLREVSIYLKEREIVGLIGNNGVGKTTFLRSLLGLADVRSGTIRFMGKDILGLSPFRIARLGIGLVPENREIFPDLTVYENLLVGTMNMRKKGIVINERVYEYFPFLKERLRQKGGTLSGGEQQMLAIARGLVGEPELLLLDEFSEGLQPLVIRNICEIVRRVRDEGTTILMVEQNARLAIRLSSRIYIMEKGEIAYHGPSEALVHDERVLGEHLAI